MFGRHRIAELTDQLTVSRGDCERVQQTLNAIASQIGYIEFSPSGIVESANDILLSNIGYERQELIGKHHRLLCDASYTASAEYQRFWDDLGRGVCGGAADQRGVTFFSRTDARNRNPGGGTPGF